MKLWFERGAWASRRGRKLIAALRREDIKRIAVIRHAALGDMVLVRPFLNEARRFFPNAEIVLSTVSNYTYGSPADLVDELHVLQGNDQKKVSFAQKFKRARELKNIDILFDFADTTRSRYLTLLAKSKIKIGFPYRGYLRNLLFDAAVFRSDFSFEAEVMLDALRLLGANPTSTLNFCWPNLQKLTHRASRIVYFPFASVPSKCWPKEQFCSLIKQLALEYPQYQHIVLGGIGKHEKTEDFDDLTKELRNIRLQGAMALESTVEFLACSTLVVSNDTGIRNLAISTATPTLGIFFSTVPFRYWPRAGKAHDAVYLPDGNIPSVEDVLSSARVMINSQIEPPQE